MAGCGVEMSLLFKNKVQDYPFEVRLYVIKNLWQVSNTQARGVSFSQKITSSEKIIFKFFLDDKNWNNKLRFLRNDFLFAQDEIQFQTCL